jgi:hypothetical protein
VTVVCYQRERRRDRDDRGRDIERQMEEKESVRKEKVMHVSDFDGRRRFSHLSWQRPKLFESES